MTASTDELRADLVRIAKAMMPLLHEPLATTVAEQWVDGHLLPTATAHAATELRLAATDLDTSDHAIEIALSGVDYVRDYLDDRAAALTGGSG